MTKETKVALITGASRGIGKEIALELAKCGYDLILHYHHHEEEINTLKTQIEKELGRQVTIIQADFAGDIEIKTMLDTICQLNPIDVLINNAALAIDNTILDKSIEEFRQVMNVNTVSVFALCQAIGTKMYQRKKGKIINIVSTNGIDTYRTTSLDYDASKAAIISLTHNFAKAYAPYVTVNAVAPGWTNTEAVLEMNPNDLAQERQHILLKRFAEPKEIAKVVAFLASDDASYINNEIIRVDGGYNNE